MQNMFPLYYINDLVLPFLITICNAIKKIIFFIGINSHGNTMKATVRYSYVGLMAAARKKKRDGATCSYSSFL